MKIWRQISQDGKETKWVVEFPNTDQFLGFQDAIKDYLNKLEKEKK